MLIIEPLSPALIAGTIPHPIKSLSNFFWFFYCDLSLIYFVCIEVAPPRLVNAT